MNNIKVKNHTKTLIYLTTSLVCIIFAATAFASTMVGDAIAENMAYKHANVRQQDTRAVECKLGADDGRTVYEIEFYAKGIKYRYAIGAYNGKVIKHEYKITREVSSKSDILMDSIDPERKYGVTPRYAQFMVLHRLIGAVEDDIIEFKTDYGDNGRKLYKGKAACHGIVYEFKIDAKSGKFLYWEEEAGGKK